MARPSVPSVINAENAGFGAPMRAIGPGVVVVPGGFADALQAVEVHLLAPGLAIEGWQLPGG